MKTQSMYKVCRRLGSGVFDKCQTQQYTLSETRHEKGKRGGRRRNVSDYGKQLLEKQRVRFAYGISERQLRRMVEEALRVAALGQDPVARMIEQLECRADNIAYRAGLAPSRRAARQLVSHGHIEVNGTRTTVPSHMLKEGDSFALRERTSKLPIMSHIKEHLDTANAPVWLTFDPTKYTGSVKAVPTADNTEMVGDVRAILEYYSR